MHTEKLLETAEFLINAMKNIADEVTKDEEICALFTKIFNALQIIAEITGEQEKLKQMVDDKLGVVKPIG